MAMPHKSISENSTSIILSSQSCALLLLFVLLLLISPHFARPIYSSSSTTRNLHPFSTSSTSIPAAQSPGKNGATDGRFEADVHEVPSGPNPESNKHKNAANTNYKAKISFEKENCLWNGNGYWIGDSCLVGVDSFLNSLLLF
ncbi:hypothetical protein Godav_023496 [Gossypium davidsonii]|uniref:Uncharacterized protein n=1 Tax=Gossypium davidsonii TaxID=34287 RepID=A0A7J8SRY7_GOSDV|nr:hypothetical protein [Gossypium davidsonii]